jgi:5-methylcytosine-specific restriction endonuclease McrA
VWQQRSQRAAIARAQQPPAPDTAPTSLRKRKKRRRNDSQWHADCVEVRGDLCRVPDCPFPHPVQMDHLIPRSQGGPSIVANGTPFCRAHHQMKTDHLLLVKPEWLDADQIKWLSDEGHAEWLDDGTVAGRHCTIFDDGQPDRSML